MKQNTTRPWLGLLGLVFSTLGYGSPAPVIAVVGPSQPLAPFLAMITEPHYTIQATHPTAPLQVSDHTESSAWVLGKVVSRRVDIKSLTQPIFIVGTDKTSREWLKRFQSRLQQLHAIGIVVNVNSNQDYDALVHEFGLHLLPINADGLAKTLGVHHYPVLISQHWIEQ